tara:strand:+ start:55 stop:264 length:210 start_codon:yes stop_codon:yes gene_type:complete
MNISESKTDSLYYCNKCNTDNIVELAWISQGGEPTIYKQTNIIKCADCMEKGINSRNHIKEKVWNYETK